jgi:branched-chain amino acid transport system substrate-binding protein
MKKLFYLSLVVLFVVFCIPFMTVAQEKPIVIGAPLSTAFLYGWDAERGIKLAVDEINAAGGVNVGGKKRPFKVEVIDTRDLEPGVPVADALLAVEKLITRGNGPSEQTQEDKYSYHRCPYPCLQ